MTAPGEPRFVADRMLGRLARMLRLLGYDTVYAPNLSNSQLVQSVRQQGRVLLTRGDAQKRFPGVESLLSVRSDNPPEQLREVVEKFRLDRGAGLWTRCTLCNGAIASVAKQQIESAVEPKVFRIYEEFYRCTGCGHVYWHGSHIERILKNLESLLGPEAKH